MLWCASPTSGTDNKGNRRKTGEARKGQSSREWTYGNLVGIALHSTFDLRDGDLKGTIVGRRAASRRACLRSDGRGDTLTSDKGRSQGGQVNDGGAHTGNSADAERVMMVITDRMS